MIRLRISLIFELCMTLSAGTLTITDEVNFRPIRATHTELAAIIDRMARLVDTANATVGCQKSAEVRIGTNARQVRIDGDFSPESLRNVPDPSYSVTFEYECRRSEIPVPIQRVSLILGDSTRKLELQGTSVDQVEAIRSNLAELISTHTVNIGGPYFRGAATSTLTVIGVLIIYLLGRWQTAKTTTIIVGLLALMLLASPYLLPMENWFPGTLILKRETSLLDSWQPLLGIASFILTVIGLIITILTFTDWLKKRRLHKP